MVPILDLLTCPEQRAEGHCRPQASGKRVGSGRVPLWKSLLLTVGLAAFVFWPIAGFGETYELISMTNAVWRYNQSNNLDGVQWMAPGDNDSGWQSGPSVLACENNAAIVPYIQTPLNAPGIPAEGVVAHAYYFRIHFNWAFQTNYVPFTFTCRLDDCAVIYLNGVLLTNIGVSTPITFASLGRPAIGTDLDASVDEVFSIVPTSLLTGDNVLAVEVHQMHTASSDVTWGTTLKAMTDTIPPTWSDRFLLPAQ